jgi:hypothetical protein
MRNLTGVMAECPTNKESLIFMAMGCLIYMVNECNIPYNLFSNFKKSGMLGQPFNTDFHMERQQRPLSTSIHIPGMEPKLY